MAKNKDKKDKKTGLTEVETDELIAQSLKEISFAREYKQGKVSNWKINEDLYYGNKIPSNEARANVDLGQMSAFVHTILSKIDNAITFKYTKQKESQVKRVTQINALKARDQQEDNWDIKDIAGKKQAIIYGRAIYLYYADSIDNEYEPHLEPVDVYNFLIDPSAGGLDIENAMYIGNYGVVKNRKQLEQYLDDKAYIKDNVKNLLDGSGNSTSDTQEVNNTDNRRDAQNTSGSSKEIGNKDKYVFWNWFTTYNGERYYLQITEKGGTAIEICKLDAKFESGLYPYWTWATFPDLTEFWTPSYCDYVREVFMAQAVSINQMLDNAEQINKPQMVVNVDAFEDLSQVKYRRGGRIEVKPGFNIREAIQQLPATAIDTPIQVFQLLDGIQEKASGVTAAAKGVAENDAGAKATIYAGNQENTADRFGFLNKAYSFGYKRFAKLYEAGVKEHLVKKVAIEILGPNGVEIREVSRRDLFRKNDKFGVSVEASDAELSLSQQEKQAQLQFLQAQAQNPNQNPKKAYELSAQIAGFDAETIRELQDTNTFGTTGMISEALRDIEMLLDGEDVKENQAADTAYQQVIVDYFTDKQEDMTTQQYNTLRNYYKKMTPIVRRNMINRGNRILQEKQLEDIMNKPPEQKAASPDAPPGAPQATPPGIDLRQVQSQPQPQTNPFQGG